MDTATFSTISATRYGPRGRGADRPHARSGLDRAVAIALALVVLVAVVAGLVAGGQLSPSTEGRFVPQPGGYAPQPAPSLVLDLGLVE